MQKALVIWTVINLAIAGMAFYTRHQDSEREAARIRAAQDYGSDISEVDSAEDDSMCMEVDQSMVEDTSTETAVKNEPYCPHIGRPCTTVDGDCVMSDPMHPRLSLNTVMCQL